MREVRRGLGFRVQGLGLRIILNIPSILEKQVKQQMEHDQKLRLCNIRLMAY